MALTRGAAFMIEMHEMLTAKLAAEKREREEKEELHDAEKRQREQQLHEAPQRNASEDGEKLDSDGFPLWVHRQAKRARLSQESSHPDVASVPVAPAVNSTPPCEAINNPKEEDEASDKDLRENCLDKERFLTLSGEESSHLDVARVSVAPAVNSTPPCEAINNPKEEDEASDKDFREARLDKERFISLMNHQYYDVQEEDFCAATEYIEHKESYMNRSPVGIGCLTCTTVLWYITFLGCGVNYMIRSNINIAIVSMAKKRSLDQSAVVSECFHSGFNVTRNHTFNESLSHVEMNDDDDDEENRFDWDEHEQNVVMGAFFWLYWAAQVPGGMLGQYYGTKKVFGIGNLMMSISTLLIPLFASLDYRFLVALRVFQGICGGVCWPSLSYMISRWIPSNERGKFMSAFMGSSVGAALTFPLCGMIIHFLNWQAVFYVTGTIGILWFISWWWLVYDNPADHPTITESELKRIQNAIGDSVSEKNLPIPWLKIVTNWPLIANILLHWGCIWGMFTILTQAPTYFRNVHGWSVQKVGFFSGLPHVCRMILAIWVGYLCDYLMSNGKLSVTNVRKLAGFIMNILQGIFTLGLAFSGCNSVMATICLTAALAMSGAESTGALATYIDLSPNFASILMGIGNMICVTPGFMSAAVVGALTYKNQSSEQWKKVYLISAGILLVPGLVYLLKSSAKVQEWNFPKSVAKEMKEYVYEKDVEAQQRLTSEYETEDHRDREEETKR